MKIIKLSKGFSDANILNTMLEKLNQKIDKILSKENKSGSFTVKLQTNKQKLLTQRDSLVAQYNAQGDLANNKYNMILQIRELVR